MIEVRELGQSWDAHWDDLVRNCPTSGFMQGSDWMRFKQSEGYETLRLGVFRDGTLEGGAVLYRYPADRKGGVVHSPEGPVLGWSDEEFTRSALRMIQSEARGFAEPVGAVAFRIEPRIPRPAPRLLRNWRRAPVDVIPIDTLTLDVARPETELLAEMRPKARYNIGLARRHGVSVSASRTFGALREFYALFEATANRRRFFCEPYGYFLNLAVSLFPTGTAEVLTAYVDGDPAASMLLVHFGKRSTFLYGGSNPRHNRLMPSHALQWAAIQRAKELGAIEYDLFGCDPYGAVDHPYHGFSRFKRQLGGTIRSFAGAFDLVFYDQLAERIVCELATAGTARSPDRSGLPG